MSADTTTPEVNADSELKQGVSGRLLYFYVLGDVLGSGIYVLIGVVAGVVGGAFWAAFTSIGITESVVANMLMTFVEVAGLVIVLAIGVIAIGQGDVTFSAVTEFSTDQNPALGLLSGVALAFFAMTGFENVANVAEETKNPYRDFPRALIGGMATAGVLYVLVAVTAAITVPIAQLAESDAALLEVVRTGILPVSVGIMTIIFAFIAMVAITNTCLVCLVTESRILYGMAREDVVPEPFSKVSRRQVPWLAILFSIAVIAALLASGADLAQLANVTVVFLLFIYALVIVSAFKLDNQDRHDLTFRAPRVLLWTGLVANVLILGYVIYDDASSLLYCAGLLSVGLVLYIAERLLGGSPTSDQEI